MPSVTLLLLTMEQSIGNTTYNTVLADRDLNQVYIKHQKYITTPVVN